MKRIVFVLNVVFLVVLSSCTGNQIDGEDLKEEFERSTEYYVAYGTEEQGGEITNLEPIGFHIVCDGYSYYDDMRAIYTLDDGEITTYVSHDGNYYLLDLPNTKEFVEYDIDELENEVWSHNYKQGFYTTTYSYNEMNGYYIDIEYGSHYFRYEISLLDDDMKYEFNNEIENYMCQSNPEEYESITIMQYVSKYIDWWMSLYSHGSNPVVLNVEFDGADTISIELDSGDVVFKLDEGNIDFLLDDIDPFTSHILNDAYSWMDESGEVSSAYYLPVHLRAQTDDLELRVYEAVFLDLKWIFEDAMYALEE